MPPRSPLVFAAALALIAPVSTRTHAQTVMGIGADALTVPEGAVRLRVTPMWTRWSVRIDPASLPGASGTSPITEQLRVERTVLVTALSAEVGLTNWLSLEMTVPFVRSRVESNFDLRLLAPELAADSTLVIVQRTGVGDVEAGARLQLFSTLARQRRLAPAGMHIRSTLAGVARLGTGTRELLADSIEIGTGDAQSDVEVRSEWDVVFGRRVWASAVARYGWQLARQEETAGATSGVIETLDRDLGDYLEVEVTPRISLGRYFGIGVRYLYRSKAADRITLGSTPGGGASVTERESRVFGGIAYSSVAAFRERQARVPLDVSLQYGRTVGGATGGAHPVREVVLQARLYGRLFGRGPIR